MIGPQGTNQMREKLRQVLNEKSTSKYKRKIGILELLNLCTHYVGSLCIMYKLHYC